MMYPIKVNKKNWRSLVPMTNHSYSDEYVENHCDLYLSAEYLPGSDGVTHRYLRLHAERPHSIEMALAYDIKCPKCGRNNLKQVGRCVDLYTLGLYECPVCDRK